MVKERQGGASLEAHGMPVRLAFPFSTTYRNVGDVWTIERKEVKPVSYKSFQVCVIPSNAYSQVRQSTTSETHQMIFILQNFVVDPFTVVSPQFYFIYH